MYKFKSAESIFKQYGTTNMDDHMKTCFTGHGKQTSMGSFVKRVPDKKKEFMMNLRSTLEPLPCAVSPSIFNPLQ